MIYPETKYEIRKVKAIIGYEESQPRCNSCVRKTNRDMKLWCGRYNILITKSAVCNDWKNKLGETLGEN